MAQKQGHILKEDELEQRYGGIRCLALDLDRTTLDNQGRLSPRTRIVLEQAAEAGIHVVVASGRARDSLPADVLAVKGIRYAITSNGAAVYDLHTGECIRQYKLTEESVRGILEYAGELPVAYEAFIDGKPYAQKAYVEDPVAFGATEAAIPYIQSTREPVADISGFLREHVTELDSIDLVVANEELKQKIWEELPGRVSDLYITSSVEQLLEISYRDCGKHSGAGFLLEHLGLSADALAAFGDGDNDAELLLMAGVGIAVANGSPRCLAAADWIALSHDRDGVALEIERILRAREAEA